MHYARIGDLLLLVVVVGAKVSTYETRNVPPACPR
jgi:hypothetical protein